MAWAVKAGSVGASRWAKWVDLEAASKQFQALKSLMERADTASLMSSGELEYANRFGRTWQDEIRMLGAIDTSADRGVWWSERAQSQTERVRQIAATVRALALALDVLPIALGTYQTARIKADPGRDDLRIYLVPPETQVWPNAAIAAFQAGGVPEVNGLIWLETQPYCRADFDASGNVVMRTDVPEPLSGSDGRRAWTDQPQGWQAWDGWIFQWWLPPGFGADATAEVSALLPLKFAWEFWSGIARTLLSLKINGALARTAAVVTLRNVALSKSLGGSGLPDTILNASAALDVAHLSGDAPLDADEQALVGGVVALIAAINPVAGAVAGVVVAVGELIASLLPPAVAVPLDLWGRRGFFLESQNFTGKLAPRTAPTQSLPDPVVPLGPTLDDSWTEGVLGEEQPRRQWTYVGGDDSGGGDGGGTGGGLVIVGGLALLAKLLLG